MAVKVQVTQEEHSVPDGAFIYSKTDLKGIIQEANGVFADLSAYKVEDLIGRAHNIVRHPDMPKEAFADMWKDLKAGLPWRGVVKNRRQDGGYYWVVANASPVFEGKQVVGYQSVRTKPTREEIRIVDAVYKKISAGDKSIQIIHGQAVAVRSRFATFFESLKFKLFLAPALGLLASTLGFVQVYTTDNKNLFSYLLLCVLSLLFTASVITIGRFASGLLHDLNSFDKYLEQILLTGDLRKELFHDRKDELAELSRKFSLCFSWLRTSLMCVESALQTVSTLTGEIKHAVETVDHSADSQQTATGSIAAAIEELSITIGEIAERLNTTEHAVSGTGRAASEGAELSSQATTQIQSLNEAIQQVSGEVAELSNSSQKVSQIAGVIREIADQTNLLALNASIEAARAGESGRGFAVVANEVRQLADRTMRATENIDSLIGAIQAESAKAIQGMKQSADQVSGSVDMVVNLRNTLGDMYKRMDETIALITGIAAASSQQSAAVKDIGMNMSNVAGLTEHNREVVRDTKGKIDTLTPRVDRAQAAVGQFEFF